ncbi:MAG: TlpA family protein disulfide reductase [Acidimicrobiales bacterium]
MERLVLAAAIVFAAAIVAVLIQRRRPEPPTQGRWPVPTQLDRADFDRPGVPWLIAVFTSPTCDACAEAMARAAPLSGPEVVVQEVEAVRRADLHRRYGVEAVPTTVLADSEGVVRASFVGPPAESELRETVAEVRAGDIGPDPEAPRSGVGGPPGGEVPGGEAPGGTAG